MGTSDIWRYEGKFCLPMIQLSLSGSIIALEGGAHLSSATPAQKNWKNRISTDSNVLLRVQRTKAQPDVSGQTQWCTRHHRKRGSRVHRQYRLRTESILSMARA